MMTTAEFQAALEARGCTVESVTITRWAREGRIGTRRGGRWAYSQRDLVAIAPLRKRRAKEPDRAEQPGLFDGGDPLQVIGRYLEDARAIVGKALSMIEFLSAYRRTLEHQRGEG